MDLDSPQRGRNTLRDAPGEPEEAPHGMFSCAICLDEHSMQDCYTASMRGHRMCRKAARKVVLGAVRFAPALDNSLSQIVHLAAEQRVWGHWLSASSWQSSWLHGQMTPYDAVTGCNTVLQLNAKKAALSLRGTDSWSLSSWISLPSHAPYPDIAVLWCTLQRACNSSAKIAEPANGSIMGLRQFFLHPDLSSACFLQELVLPGALSHLPGQVRAQVYRLQQAQGCSSSVSGADLHPDLAALLGLACPTSPWAQQQLRR